MKRLNLRNEYSLSLLCAAVLTLSSCGDESPIPGSNMAEQEIAAGTESSESVSEETTTEAPAESVISSMPDTAEPMEVVSEMPETPEPAEAIDSSGTEGGDSPDTEEPVEPAVPVAAGALCEGGIFHSQSVAIPELLKPEYLQPYTDPAFGNRVVKITDNEFGGVSKPPYSTMQAWNADESLLLIYNTGTASAGHVLLDGHSYEFKQSLNISPSDLEEVYWSHTDPDSLFYVSTSSSSYGQLLKYNVRTSSATVIRDFTDYCDSGIPTGGSDIHMQSLDDDLFGFRCQDDDGHYNMISYRLTTDEVVASPIGGGSGWAEWTAPTPAPSGARFWYQGASLSTHLDNVLFTMDVGKDSEHSNVGRTAEGQDALYQTSFDPSPNGCNGDTWQGVGHLIEHNLETGECRPIINQEQGYPYTTSGTHVSAQAYRAPERIAMSSIGNDAQLEFFGNGVAAPALLSEIYIADTGKNSDNICRLAHHRSYGKRATKGGYAPYFGEPHATISPSGTRILFGSDWYDSGSVDSYVVELPGYVRP